MGWRSVVGDGGKPMTRQRLAAIATGGALLIMAAIGWVSYRHNFALVETARRIAQTHQTLTALEVLLAKLADAESARQGHVIAGGMRHLEAYHAALGEIDRTLQHLRRLTADNPNQQQRIGMLRAMLDEKVALLQHSIDIQEAEGFHPERQIVLTDRGQALLDQVRWIVETMKGEEQTLLAHRGQTEIARWRLTSIGMPLGFGLAAALLLLVLYLFRREVAERSYLEAELQHARNAAEAARGQ
jgi:CHASE3 domain sensor protein